MNILGCLFLTLVVFNFASNIGGISRACDTGSRSRLRQCPSRGCGRLVACLAAFCCSSAFLGLAVGEGVQLRIHIRSPYFHMAVVDDTLPLAALHDVNHEHGFTCGICGGLPPVWAYCTA